MDLYSHFGAREYWIVDPEVRTVTVLTLTGDQFEPFPLTDDGMIQSRVLPGLDLALAAIFTGITES